LWKSFSDSSNRAGLLRSSKSTIAPLVLKVHKFKVQQLWTSLHQQRHRDVHRYQWTVGIDRLAASTVSRISQVGLQGLGKFRDERLQEIAPDYQSGNALRMIGIAMPLSGVLIRVIPRLLGD